MSAPTGLDFLTTLVRYETYLWNDLDVRLRDAGHVALPTLFTLDVVDRYDGRCRVLEIRRDIGITVGAASKLVDRLEADGLVVRTPNPRDRRSSLVLLTPDGHTAHAEGRRTLAKLLDEHLAGEPRLAQTTATLGRLLERLSLTDD